MCRARLIVNFLSIFLIVSMLVGCNTLGSSKFLSAHNFLPSDDPLKEAQIQFKHGNYGLAEKHYRKAVEKNPNSLESWLGLAASYDHLRRFDLADKAYDTLRELVGDTPSVLNNVGYSYLLRGDLKKAETILKQAHNQDPGNPFIQNNIDILKKRLSDQGNHTVSSG